MSSTKSNYKLNDKQRRFAEEYILDSNATQSAIRAGYSKRTAKSQGQRLLKHPEVSRYISDLQNEIRERNKITVDELVQRLSNIARTDIVEFYNKDGSLKSIHDIPAEHREGIEEVTGKKKEIIGYKSSGKQGAIDKLLKHLGGYEKDNKQKDANNVVIFNIPDNGRG